MPDGFDGHGSGGSPGTHTRSGQVAALLPWLCVASGALTTVVGFNHLFAGIPFMVVTLGICTISLIVVLVVAVRSGDSGPSFSLGLALSLILVSPVPYILLVLYLMGNYWG